MRSHTWGRTVAQSHKSRTIHQFEHLPGRFTSLNFQDYGVSSNMHYSTLVCVIYSHQPYYLVILLWPGVDPKISLSKKIHNFIAHWRRHRFFDFSHRIKLYRRFWAYFWSFRKIASGQRTVIVPGPGSRSYRVPTLPDPTGYYYCTLQLGCCIVVAICSVHLEVN